MALCVTASSSNQTDAAVDDQELKELKAAIWAGFKDMVNEISEKKGSYDEASMGSFKDFIKPFSEKHSAGLGKKIQEFKEKHPEADVKPQSLLALSTEQTQQVPSLMKSPCEGTRAPLMLFSSLYCSSVFGWNLDFFNVWACSVSFLIPFEAVCFGK